MAVDIRGYSCPLLPWACTAGSWNILSDQAHPCPALHPRISCVHSPWRILPPGAGNCEGSHVSNFSLSTRLNAGGLGQHPILFGISQECSGRQVTHREASHCAGG